MAVVGSFLAVLGSSCDRLGGCQKGLGGVLGLSWGVREASDAPLVDIRRPLWLILVKIRKV